MDLPSFIRKAGIDKCCELFDARPGAVKGWLYGERFPRPKKGRYIEEQTRNHPVGRVRFSEIYAPAEKEPATESGRAAA